MALCVFVFLIAVSGVRGAGSRLPGDNPVARYQLDWTDSLKWSNVVGIKDFEGDSVPARLEKAQEALAKEGGGVVYFPAGVYTFSSSIRLKSGIVLRGASPQGTTDARRDGYDPPTRFEFPKYEPTFAGQGTPIETAFKGIYLEDPARASDCGIVNVAINRGHIDFQEGPDHQCGRNRLVYGCLLRNAAVADPRVPDTKRGQHAWQRFTHRHHAAVTVKSSENVLIANNRLPKSGDDDFAMKGYVLKGKPFDVVFDYDNRPGLYINDYGLGGAGGRGPDGTPQTHPWGFRKGTVIRDNYVFCTGRCAISFSGDGTICADNVVRFEDDVYRPTTTGTNLTTGSATNDNRAVQMRGWHWTVQGNDYLVYRNWAADRSYRINDGEGLMHEDHVNSTVRDSKLIGNKGNAYISIYKTAGVDGLLVKDNDIRTQDGLAAIFVVANRNSGPYECRNVTICDNTTVGSGIHIAGDPADNNVIRNNRHIGPGGRIKNEADAACENNTGYEIVGQPP
ncbi:MAG: hypothetical protein JW741_06260 [Sedimentisphaerales bacterium]|nr:hypothetical protein [Sedimentisphaerales bacterium]